MADASGATYRLVDPTFPDRTLRYNRCTDSPADVSNKLIGALSFGSDGEVYKQVSQQAIGIVTAGQQALGRKVTLNSLRSSHTQRRRAA